MVKTLGVFDVCHLQLEVWIVVLARTLCHLKKRSPTTVENRQFLVARKCPLPLFGSLPWMAITIARLLMPHPANDMFQIGQPRYNSLKDLLDEFLCFLIILLGLLKKECCGSGVACSKATILHQQSPGEDPATPLPYSILHHSATTHRLTEIAP